MKKALHLPRGWIPLYRVVCRSNNNSNANGGVSYANCGNDSSSSFTNIGSRLAFRGEIEEAESVTAFKAIKAILA